MSRHYFSIQCLACVVRKSNVCAHACRVMASLLMKPETFVTGWKLTQHPPWQPSSLLSVLLETSECFQTILAGDMTHVTGGDNASGCAM